MDKYGEKLPRSMFKTCFVPQCRNTTTRTPEKCFIYVPRDDDKRKAWCRAAGCKQKKLPATTYICEDHFNLREDMENFLAWKLTGARKVMKKDAYPRFFRCQINKLSTPTTPKMVPVAETVSVPEIVDNSQMNSSDTQLTDWANEKINEREENIGVDSNTDSENASSSLLHNKFSIEDSHIQEKMSYRIFPVDRYVQTDIKFHEDKKSQIQPPQQSIGVSCVPEMKDVALSPHKYEDDMEIDPNSSASRNKSNDILEMSADTVPSGSILENSNSVQSMSASSMELDTLLKTIFESVARIIIEDDPLSFLGLPETPMHVIDELEKHAAIPREYIYLILKKIRQNVPNSILAYDFGYSKSQVARIFTGNITLIAYYLHQLITWPSKEDITRNLPIQFRMRYANVQSIIDCFEIQIEHLSDSLHQAVSWSEYKKGNTAKYLISITPDGFINYISPGYGGRTSDMEIVRDSGYLNVLPVGPSVLVDRGFKQIDALFRQRNCTLIRPPSVSADSKPTKNEVNLTQQIASVRIHVERVIRRLREFKMLECHSTVDHYLLDRLDDVVIIAAAIVNLQSVKIK